MNSSSTEDLKHGGQTKIKLLLPMIILIGLFLSFMTYATISYYETQAIKEKFEGAAQKQLHTLERELASDIHALTNIRDFYAASEFVERDEFKQFTKNTLIRHKSLRAVEWIPRIVASERQKYTDQAIAQGFKNFEIFQNDNQGRLVVAPEKKEYYPVYYVEPYHGNERALGYDLSTKPNRKVALERARDEGKPIATAPVQLVQSDKKRTAFLLFVPIYENSMMINTLEQRREAIKGFGLGAFEVRSIINRVLDFEKNVGIYIQIKDVTDKNNQTLLYNSLPSDQKENEYGGFQSETIINVGERSWLVASYAGNDFAGGVKNYTAWAGAGSILLFTLFLTYILFTTLKRNEIISREVKEALTKIKTLSGLIPICAYCKKMRNDTGYWGQVEEYLKVHAEVDFSHGICPDCYAIESKKLENRK